MQSKLSQLFLISAVLGVLATEGVAHATLDCDPDDDPDTHYCEADDVDDANDFSIASVIPYYDDPDDATICDWKVVIGPGKFDDDTLIIDVDTSECTDSTPVRYEAATPCLGQWTTDDRGPAVNDCNDPGDTGYEAEDSSFNLDDYLSAFETYHDETYTYIRNIKFGTSTVTDLNNVKIRGFATTSIGPWSSGGARASCDECGIYQNFVFEADDNCISLPDSDNPEIAGNKMLKCGGADSGDLDLKTDGSTGASIHHNELKGSGSDNVGMTDPQGTDGWTIGSTTTASSCGARFFQNNVLSHGFRGPDSGECTTHHDDGNGIDIKWQSCEANPIRIYDNYIADNHGAAVAIHRGSTGVQIYNNEIESNDEAGVAIDPGDACNGTSDGGYVSHIFVYGNEIRENLGNGVVIDNTPTSCAAETNRDVYQVHIFNNDLTRNGDPYRWSNVKQSDGSCQGSVGNIEYGIFVKWVTEYDTGTSSSLTAGRAAEGWTSGDILLGPTTVSVANNYIGEDHSSTDNFHSMRLKAATSTYVDASKDATYAERNVLHNNTFYDTIGWFGAGDYQCFLNLTTCYLDSGRDWSDFLPTEALDGGGDDVFLYDVNGDPWHDSGGTMIGAYGSP